MFREGHCRVRQASVASREIDGLIVTIIDLSGPTDVQTTNERMEFGVSLSVYDITVPVMVHGLNVMNDYLVLHQLRHVRLDLVAAYGELFSESEHVGREPLAKNSPRLKGLGSLECLGVVEIVVHHVQSVHHDRDRDVIDREGHADLHTLVCSWNVGRAR